MVDPAPRHRPSHPPVYQGLDRAQRQLFDTGVCAQQPQLDGLVHEADRQVPQYRTQAIEQVTVDT